MLELAFVLLLATPETERLVLGPSPFFRAEGVERARRSGDRELLERAARSNLWDARRLAAQALGHAAPAELLDDPVAVVREAAVRALGAKAPDDRLVALLEDEDDAVRAGAAWALVGRTPSRAVRALARDPSLEVRVAGLAAAGSFGKLTSLSKDKDLATAVAALHALGRAGGPAQAAALLRRLDAAVKRAAGQSVPLYLRDPPGAEVALARAVGDLARRGVAPHGKRMGDLLSRIADRHGLEGSAAILMAETVAGARDPELARRILDAQLHERRGSTLPNAYFDPAVRSVLQALGREPWPQLAPLLLPLLEDRDPAVRLAVVQVLEGPAVLTALRDPVAAVRAAACARVARLEPLGRMVSDPAMAVRASCARALGRLGDAAAVPLLEKLLAKGDREVRRSAVGAFLRVDFAHRGDLLYRVATGDPDAAVRRAAGAVLAFLQEPEVLPRAIDDLAHAEAERRRGAIDLIHALTTARIEYDPLEPAAGAQAWRRWWDRRRARLHAPDAFRYHVEDLRRRGIDLVLVMDATGSMAPVIQATKRRLETVVRGLRQLVPDLRTRIVAYRDEGDTFVTLGSALSHDARLLEDFLAGIPAAGGGDYPEAVLAGLRNAFGETPWRDESQRIVLLFGDAPPHERDMTLVQTLVTEFSGVVHAVAATSRSRLPAFRTIATWGGGSFVGLADEEDLLRKILVLTLGPAHQAAVEALFGL
jgi:HEAT repeat protein